MGSSNDSLAIAKGVTAQHRKAILINSYQGVINPYSELYVQQLHAESSLTSDTETERYTADGLGQTKLVTVIQSGTDYQLKKGEYLCINYTPSSAEDSSSSATINKVYSEGAIVRVSKDLTDSADYRLTHNYSKTSGYDFTADLGGNIAGMFTLGTDEQIEIREFIQVKLDKQATNIYWNLNNESENSAGNIVFPLDKDHPTYTLQDNEYFYYTDKDKQTLVYYGAGTKLTRGANTPTIYKSVNDNHITTEEIASEGLTAAISWRPYNFSGNDAAITIQEYQYINLIQDDELTSISLTDNTEGDIDSTERDCTAAQYKANSSGAGAGELPPHNLLDSAGNPIY